MRDGARDIFQKALAEAGISKAFIRRVECDHGVLRICDDLYDLHSYNRVFVVSIGKAGHTMILDAEMGFYDGTSVLAQLRATLWSARVLRHYFE